jgi:hypothetical protein
MANIALDPSTGVALFHDMVTGTAAAVGTFSLTPGYRPLKVHFEVLGLTGETVGVTLSSDGTNYGAALSTASILDLGTGLPVTAATLGNGSYELILPLPTFQKLKVTKSDTVETVLFSIAELLVPSV